MTNFEQKMIIGNAEWCAFPSLNIPAIKARVDSGAKTSSLHAVNIQTFTRKGQLWVNFEVHPLQDNRKVFVHCEAEVVDQRIIKSSSGDREKRYVICVPILVGEQSWDIEVTLTDRDSMGFRMLLGREAMNGRVIVDPQIHCILGDRPRDTLADLYKAPEIKESGLRIGLLASNPELYSNRRIMEAAESRGHEIQFLNVKHCYMKLDGTRPEIHYRGGRVLNDLDAVIPRIRPNMTFYACTLLRQFESLGIYCLNNSNAIAQSRDKLRSLQLLLEHDLHVPTTGFANSPLDTNDLINMVGGAPLIIKLLEGTQGKGVVLAETKKAAESVINAFKSLNANILVQEFVKEASGKDLRCFVIDGRVVASIQRIAAPGEFRANIHQGGRAELIKITPEEKRIAVKAAKAMNLKVAGVDLIRSNKGPLVLEVNSSPGLQGIETATNEDIASRMITAIEKHISGR